MTDTTEIQATEEQNLPVTQQAAPADDQLIDNANGSEGQESGFDIVLNDDETKPKQDPATNAHFAAKRIERKRQRELEQQMEAVSRGELPDIGYQFAADGEPAMDGDDHGLKTAHLSAVYHNLALRIAPDYEIEPLAKVVTTARYGKELLVKSSALKRAKKVYREAGYPNRMPIGSGNRIPAYNGHHYFHRKGDDDADSSTG